MSYKFLPVAKSKFCDADAALFLPGGAECLVKVDQAVIAGFYGGLAGAGVDD